MDSDPIERRLAAIVSADVYGYSRLMAENEDATVRMVTAYRETVELLVAQHGGRLNDFTGDNFLAEFPTAIDAVHGVLELQRVLAARNAELPPERRMQFRMGIHLGEVRVEGERLFGTGVNVAARLEALAEPGGVCVSAAVHAQLQGKLDVEGVDLGEHSVKNIPEPVRVYRLRVDVPEEIPARASPRSRLSLAAAAVAVAGLVAVVAAVWLSQPAPQEPIFDGPELPLNPPLPDKPSIVVLPFDNFGDDPQQQYFADGITEDLTNDLASVPDVFVIARNSAFTYKGKPTRVEQVGRELGVRYVLEGSVRWARERVRVTAQLIDATTGLHVWSDRYDRELSDIFAIQTELAEQILTAMRVRIREAELQRIRRRPTESLTAYEAFIQGDAHQQLFTAEGNRRARQLFERAIELDPSYADAYWGLSSTYGIEAGASFGLRPERGEVLDSAKLREELFYRAEQASRRALELDAFNPRAQALLAYVAAAQGRLDEGLAGAARAVELGPSLTDPLNVLASLQARAGDFSAALESVTRGTRLDPRGIVPGFVGAIHYLAGHIDTGVMLLEQSRATNPDLLPALVLLASHYEGAGRHEEAGAVVEEMLRINPGLTADVAATGVFFFDSDTAAKVAENLRRAGLTDRVEAQPAEAAQRTRTMRSLVGPERIMLARYYESAGRHEDAQAIVQELLSAQPEMTAGMAVDMLARNWNGEWIPEDLETHLRSAGLP